MDVATFSWIGDRGYMEDFYFLIENFNGRKDQLFGGVFDGHGGRAVAKYSALKVPQYVAEYMREQEVNIPAMFKKVYEQISSEREDRTVGCTALSCLIQNNKLFAANAGDSRMIIVSDNQIDQVTIDHDVNNEKEVNRILSFGGSIEGRYAWKGMRGLMPTRSLGDHHFDSIGIIAEPEIFSREIPKSPNTFIIIATDGIWNELGNGAVADLVDGKKTAQKAVEAIMVFVAENRGMLPLDNITLIVIKP